jgi:hypothetical protein
MSYGRCVGLIDALLCFSQRIDFTICVERDLRLLLDWPKYGYGPGGAAAGLGLASPAVRRSRPRPLRRFNAHTANEVVVIAEFSAHKVGLGEVDYFVTAPAQYSANRVKAKSQGLVKTDGRRHRQFLPVHHHLNQGGPIVRQRFG